MLKNRLTHFLKELSKRKLAALCLFAVIAVFTACQDITGPEAGIPGARFSAAKVNQTVITNQAGLAAIQSNPTGAYVLGNSFAITDWVPICGPDTTGVPFSGTLDGAGYTITINSFDSTALRNGNYIGIFQTSSVYFDSEAGTNYVPSISNLTVELATSINTAAQYVGGLVAYAQGTLFTNITVNGKFAVDDDTADDTFYFGGVAGYAELITVEVFGYPTDFASIFTGITVDAGFNINYNAGDAVLAYVGSVVGYAESATLTNINLSGVLDADYTGSAAPDWASLVIKGAFPDQAVFITAAPASGLAAGGVAGYANISDINYAVSSMVVDALSTTTAVYAGGITGYIEGTTVYNSENSADVTSNGPGYNTSAGGIAGYILAGRVRDSSASGVIRATALGKDFDYSDSWQAYAGGLVGYAGGSSAAPSVVERNYATGAVTTYAPFPYAGGLVGYNYGYNNFTNPAKNGSRIAESYATGSVTASSQDDPNGVYGDIPYAGGLVGYSSVVESRIIDSYATGNVSATTNGTYAWAGGVIGGNANDSTVTRTYSTSNVTSTAAGTLPPLYPPQYADAGPAAGGIAGFNYYTAKTTVSYSVALNNTVNGNQSVAQNVVHRVAGSIGNAPGTGTLTDNLANENMTIGANWKSDIGENLRDGANTAPQPAQSVYEDLGWDFRNIWTLSGGYPILQWK
jgi:hypothetical protein